VVAREKLIEIVESVLDDYARIKYVYDQVERQTVFDRNKGRFLLMIDGWDNDKRVHGCLIDVQIKNNKLWIERDGTEEGVGVEFERLGVPTSQMVLAWYPEDVWDEDSCAVR
jgi:XisI protein